MWKCFQKRAIKFNLIKDCVIIKNRQLSFDTNGVFKSNFGDIGVPDLSLSEFVWERSLKWPNKTAVVCTETGRNYTFNEIFKKSRHLSGFLQSKFKLKKDDTVAVILPNIPEYPIVVLGAIDAGLKVTTINPRYTKDEIEYQLTISEAKVVIAFHEIISTVQEITKRTADIPIIAVHTQRGQATKQGIAKLDEIVENSFNFTPVLSSADDVALLLFSSGTTGLPKAVQLTHRNMVVNQLQVDNNKFNLFLLYHENAISSSMSFFHSGGFSGLISSLVNGSKMLATPRFGSKMLLEELINYKPNLGLYTPLVIQMLANNPNFKPEIVQCLKCIHSAGAPLGKTDIQRFLDKIEWQVSIIQGYGLTETSPFTHRQPLDGDPQRKIASVGVPILNTQVKIVSTENIDTNGLGAHQLGEILLKGPQVMKGYFKNPKATAETITKDGWLRSGDLGYMDEDGYLYVTDRLKQLIKVKGFQVAPAELEEILRNHPAVDEAAVVGIKHDRFGEVPRAFVVLKPEKRTTELEIKEFVAKKVVDYKRLEGGVMFLNELPKSNTGKLLRRELQDL